MTQYEYTPAPQGRDDGHPNKGGDGPQPNSSGSGGAPSFPFSITITIEIKGESTCPPDVKVRKG